MRGEAGAVAQQNVTGSVSRTALELLLTTDDTASPSSGDSIAVNQPDCLGVAPGDSVMLETPLQPVLNNHNAGHSFS